MTTLQLEARLDKHVLAAMRRAPSRTEERLADIIQRLWLCGTREDIRAFARS